MHAVSHGRILGSDGLVQAAEPIMAVPRRILTMEVGFMLFKMCLEFNLFSISNKFLNHPTDKFLRENWKERWQQPGTLRRFFLIHRKKNKNYRIIINFIGDFLAVERYLNPLSF